MTRRRGPLLLLAFVVAGLVTVTLLSPRPARTAALDPENPSPGGARAVAQVLRSHGVRVSVVRRAGTLDATAVDKGTTLLVTSTDNLGDTTARRLRRRAAAAGTLVLTAPGPAVLHALHLPLRRTRWTSAAPTGSHCTDPLLGDLAVDAGWTRGYRAAGPARSVGCFPTSGTPGAPSSVARVDGGTPTYVLGGPDLLANGAMLRSGNAALALRVLGQRDRLVWYVADRRDVPPGDAAAARLPRALAPSLLLLALALLATLAWRGRRFGPLAAEPLPVIVKAVESTQGRGRLYRKVGDRDHAAGVLRRATVRRLAWRLRLPAEADPQHLVGAVAEATGRDGRDVHDLLVSRPVPDDTALTALARDLAALEKETLHP